MYYNIAKSLIFAGRNNDKVFNQNDEGRVFAEIGQISKAAASTAKLDNAVGRGTRAAIDTFCKVAEGNKALDTIGKGVKIAQNNVNPLLVGAAAYRVLKADDKEKALKREALGMGMMFGVENLMKEGFSSESYQKYISSIKNPTLRAIAETLQGVAFVVGSVSASTAGYKIGDKWFDKKGKTETTLKTDKTKTSKEIKLDLTPSSKECKQTHTLKMAA